MPLVDLLPTLDLTGVDHQELQVLLTQQFSIMRMSSTNSVRYLRQDESAAAIGVFSGEELTHLYADASLSSDEAAKLRELCGAEAAARADAVYTFAIFTKKPVTGWWRHSDQLQLRPVPGDTERAAAQFLGMSPHPAYVDLKVRLANNGLVNTVRMQNRRREVELLLNMLLCAPLLETPGGLAASWIYVGGPSDLSSELRQHGYLAPELGISQKDALPEPDCMPAQVVDLATYYGGPLWPLRETLDVPEHLSELFEAYRALPARRRRQFLQACFWYREATKGASTSLSYLSLITAIEALLPVEPTRTDAYGRPATGSATKSFVEFMQRYAPSATNGELRELYRHRSKLAHGGVLLGDRAFIWGLVPEDQYNRQRDESTRQTIQIALINWMLQTTLDLKTAHDPSQDLSSTIQDV